MAADELEIISLRDDFYRDGYYKALTAVGILLAAIALLVSTSLYLQLSKPKPVTFATGDEFRTLLPVPVNKQYISQPDLIQWVSDVLPKAFTFSFINYNEQLKNVFQYFTANGWKNYTDQLKMYADYNAMVTGKLFAEAQPAGAPIIMNQALLPNGAYGWLIQMPLNFTMRTHDRATETPLVIRALIMRVPTVNNLSGVAIEQLSVTKGSGDQIISNE